MSGSGGDKGYDYQADAVAYVAAHGLAGQRLGWFEDIEDIPGAWLCETGGPGDDFRVLTTGDIPIEIQVKHGLQRGEEYEKTFRKMFRGLVSSDRLRTAVMVDRHASAIIREDLKNDLVRVGQGRTDGLRAITSDLLALFHESGHTDRSVLARLRIVVVDLDEGADGVAAARAYLSSVVEPSRSATAYELLGKRGHGLIKNRGQDNVLKCSRYLDTNVGLSAQSPSSAIVIIRFANWVRSVNERFYSPAMQRQYPVANAWDLVAQMDTERSAAGPSLDMQIKRYQEWSRLEDMRRSDAMSAESFIRDHRLTVVVAGPGSGKSTLGKKLVSCGAKESLAILVRLPVIAKLLGEGRTFNSALVEAAIDRSGCDREAGEGLLGMADLLVADGLDECDPLRSDVAAALANWASGHERTSVCVLTRPVGHAPDMLPGFSHVELLPLDSGDVRRLAGWLIRSLPAEEEASERLNAFMTSLDARDDRDVRLIAARNPLLLSFLVRLFLDGEPLDGKRSQLFEHIIELIRKSSPQGRSHIEALPDRATAWRVAEIAGWRCVDAPNPSFDEILRHAAAGLGQGLDFQRQAESALDMWIEHGLVEILTAGSKDALVFAHLGLAEFLAGRYIARLDDESLAIELRAHSRKSKWREPIVFAGGSGDASRIGRVLLHLDRPGDLESTEAVLAAAAMAESEAASVAEDVVRDIANNLKHRLRSPIPLLAIDAAIGLADLAPFIPDLVASISLELWHEDQEWTSFAARCAGLTTGSRAIPIEYVVDWINQLDADVFRPSSNRIGWRFGGTTRLGNAALLKALYRVMQEVPEADARSLAKKALEHTSLATLETVESAFTEEPQKSLLLQIRSELMSPSLTAMANAMAGFAKSEGANRSGMVRVAKEILDACGFRHSPEGEDPPQGGALGNFFASIEFWELRAGDMAALEFIDASAMLPVIIRGLIAALGADRSRLGLETSGWLNRLFSSGKSILPPRGAKREFDPSAVNCAELDLAVLCEALSHPCHFIACNAAGLIETCAPNPDLAQLLEAVLSAGRGLTLHLVGYLAKSVWGESAFEHLHDRLGKHPSEGCQYLYVPLLNAALSSEEVSRAINRLLEATEQPDNMLAAAAADALRGVEPGFLLGSAQRIRDCLEKWNTKSILCSDCGKPVAGTSCDDCRIVPRNPRQHLVFLLCKTRALSLEEMLSFAIDRVSDVRKEACAALSREFFENGAIREKLLALLRGGTAPVSVLKEIFDYSPQELRKFEVQLSALLDKSPAEVREQVVRSLDGGWTSAGNARELAQRAAADPAPEVRSRAVQILRRLAQA